MGFRGVLLTMRDGDGGREGTTDVFRVVCPDALLQLPTNGVPRDAPHVVEQKMLVTDFVTSDLQQVTRLSGVTLQRETRSALWLAIVPSTLSANEEYSSVYAFDSQNFIRRVCYCFYFRSQIEFDVFESAHIAARRLQQYSLLENSLKLELAIQRDLELKPKPKQKVQVVSNVPVPDGHEELRRRREHLRKQLQARSVEKQQQLQAQAIREQAAELEAARVKAAAAEAKRAKDAIQASSQLAVLDQSQLKAEAMVEECTLCGTDSTLRRFAGTFVNHPYVLKDGRGAPVMICKICLQRVLKRRAMLVGGRGQTFLTADELCGLCAETVAEIKGETKACSHPQCQRVYCSPCLKKLFGKARAQKVWRTKHWECTNCTPTSQDGATKAAESETAGDIETGKKKRKRDGESNKVVALKDITPDMVELPTPAIDVDVVVARDVDTGLPMTLLDYARNYYEFLTNREEGHSSEDSEDVCFCCKDGGDVLECDWKGCPKVYHQGFEVNDNEEWLCPRHRCYKCGFAALYACRFCVTAFCKGHFPNNTKVLGPGSAEIADMTYVMCPTCDDLVSKGIERSKISSKLHDRMLNPPDLRKQQRGVSKSKVKKRVR